MSIKLFLDEFIDSYVIPFQKVRYIYFEEAGWVVWRLGTGSNVELLHIRTFVKGKGFGRYLFYRMMDELDGNPPYHSVFGFTRVSNLEAVRFYGALGFNTQTVNGLYEEGAVTVFFQSYYALRESRRVYEDSVHS